jgi:hypothetical protein
MDRSGKTKSNAKKINKIDDKVRKLEGKTEKCQRRAVGRGMT